MEGERKKWAAKNERSTKSVREIKRGTGTFHRRVRKPRKLTQTRRKRNIESTAGFGKLRGDETFRMSSLLAKWKHRSVINVRLDGCENSKKRERRGKGYRTLRK